MYNAIVLNLRNFIGKINRDSILLSIHREKIDPTSITDNHQILTFLDIDDIKAIVSKYSGYSVE